MSLSPERAVSSYVLKDSPELARPARMSASLVDSPFAPVGQSDPRLVDPLLQAVVEQAENEARARGFRAGYDAGYATGREEGMIPLLAQEARAREQDDVDRIEHRRTLDQLVEGIRQAVGASLTAREPQLAEQLDLITDMAVEIAQALVGHHLEVGGCAAADAVARALRDVPRGASVVLRMHPQDVTAIADLQAGVLDWDIVAVRSDSTIERYGCIAVSQDLEVDAQLGLALANVRRVLHP